MRDAGVDTPAQVACLCPALVYTKAWLVLQAQMAVPKKIIDENPTLAVNSTCA